MAKLRKSDLIREYLPKYPELGPSALAKRMSEEHPSVKVTPQEISTMRSKLKLGRGASSSAQPKADVASVVEHLKRAIDLVGKDQARRILDVL